MPIYTDTFPSLCADEGTTNETVIRMGQDEELQDREVHKPMQHDSKPRLREGNVQQEVSENTNGQGGYVSNK